MDDSLFVPKAFLEEISSTNSHYICDEPLLFQKTLRRKYTSPDSLSSLLEELKQFLNDHQSLAASLLPFESIETENSAAKGVVPVSMMKCLLRVDLLQTALIAALIEVLNELGAQQADDTESDIPHLILREIRWLEHIEDPLTLTNKLLEVLDAGACPLPLQREIIEFIPEVICDDFEVEVAEKIAALFQSNDDLLVPALDALTQLTLPSELLLAVLEDVISRLDSTDPTNLPVLVKFLLQSAPHQNASALRELLACFRSSLHLGDVSRPSNRDSTALTLDTMGNCLRMRTDVANAFFKTVSDARSPSQFFAIDLWFCFYMHTSPQYRTKVVTLVKKKANSGCLLQSHVLVAVKGLSGALEQVFPSVMSLVSELMRGTRHAHKIGAYLYALMFVEFETDGYFRQEVVAALVGHIGSGDDFEADAALSVFDLLLNEEGDDLGPLSSRIAALAPFIIFLKGTLDFVSSMTNRNVRRLFKSLFALGSESVMDGSMDDIHILIRKLLSTSNTERRRHGIIGALAFLTQTSLSRSVAPEEEETMMDGDLVQTVAAMSEKALGEVRDMYQLCLEACARDADLLGFLMEETTRAVEHTKLHTRVVSDFLGERFMTYLQDMFIGDKDPGNEGRERAIKALNEFNPNSSSSSSSSGNSLIPVTLWGDLDFNVEGILYLNVLPLAINRAESLKCLSRLLRLVSACELSAEASAEGVDATLGCPIALADVKELLEDDASEFMLLPERARYAACLAHKIACDVIVDLINVFVLCSHDLEYRFKVGCRLAGLCELMNQLAEMTLLTPSYAEQVGLELMKEEEEEQGASSQLACPAKKKKKTSSAKKRSKNEMMQLARKTTSLSIAVFRPEVSSVLAWPSVERFSRNSLGETIPSQLRTETGAFETLRFNAIGVLLGNMERHLTLLKPPKRTPFNNSVQVEVKDLNSETSIEDILDLLIKEGVFKALHNLLLRLELALVDDLDQDTENYARRVCMATENDEGSDDAWPCFHQLVAIITALCESSELLSERGSAVLVLIVHQVAGKTSGAELNSESCIEVYSWIFSKLKSFIPMEHSLVLCADILRVMETVVTSAKSLAKLVDPSTEYPLHDLRDELSQSARALLQRQDLGGTSRVPGRVVGFLVATHLNHSASRQDCLEAWASDVLPLMSGDPNDQVDALVHFPTLCTSNFPHYFGPLLAALCTEFKHSNLEASHGRDPLALLIKTERLTTSFHLAMVITRIPGLQSNGVLMAALKEGKRFVEAFLLAMPLFKELLITHQSRVVAVWKELQMSTRQLQSLAAHGKTHRVPTLAREAPGVRKVLESMLYAVKAACTSSLVSPKDADFFVIGSLKNRNVDGSIYTAPVKAPSSEEEDDDDEQYKANEEVGSQRPKKSKGKAVSRKRKSDDDETESESDDDGYGSLVASESE